MKENVQDIRISEYDYDLPDERIARFPAVPRDSSQLLVWQNGQISDHFYHELPSLLPADAHLVFNETKVVQARLKFQKNQTTEIEVFCLQPLENQDIQQAMQSGSPVFYQCLIGGARKWKSGFLEKRLPNGALLQVEKTERLGDSFIVKFSWEGRETFAEILEQTGQTPLPPYLNRAPQEADKKTYQTLFAKKDGSVAAPTAGLHFTEELLEKLKVQNITSHKLTLHVGAGTFRPVSSEKIGGHAMHAEEFFISKKLVFNLLENIDKTIIPVGTTAMRALESIYWLGSEISKKRVSLHQKNLEIPQWVPYQNETKIPTQKCLQNLYEEFVKKDIQKITAKTRLMIVPDYKMKICHGLITNFHQPKSTLLLLVAALLGKDWKKIYDRALLKNYRFLSYGDGCLLLKNKIH